MSEMHKSGHNSLIYYCVKIQKTSSSLSRRTNDCSCCRLNHYSYINLYRYIVPFFIKYKCSSIRGLCVSDVT